MLLAVLVVASSFALSSALSSAQCITAYNATFNSTTNGTSCSEAYLALVSGNFTTQQEMMVCDSGQQCNTMIESITNLCGNTISSPTKTDHNLLCNTNPNGTTCYSSFRTGFSLLFNVPPSCAQNCSQTCKQNLMMVNTTLGCCAAEILQGLVETMTSTSSQASAIANTYPESCNLSALLFCNGSAVPSNPCDEATTKLLGVGDNCTRTASRLFGGGDASILDLYDGDCPTRFYAFATACNASFGNESEAFVQLAKTILDISRARTADGGNCKGLLAVFIPDDGGDHDDDDDDDEGNCNRDYFLNQCSAGCRQLLMNSTMQYDCCLNTLLGEFTGRGSEVHQQIDFIVHTREMYSVCEITSAGFCDGTNPPAYTDAAEQCISARKSFFADDTCLNSYLALSNRSSANAVNKAANAICSSQRCKNRMDSYTNFLTACQVDYFLAGSHAENTQLAYFTGNTTCRVDSSNTSCYSTVYFNQQLRLVSSAFDSRYSDSLCNSAITEQNCSLSCALTLNMTSNMIGCCFGEFGRALLGADVFAAVLNLCNITSVPDRCVELQAVQDADSNGHSGAHVVGGLGITAIILLGVLANALY